MTYTQSVTDFRRELPHLKLAIALYKEEKDAIRRDPEDTRDPYETSRNMIQVWAKLQGKADPEAWALFAQEAQGVALDLEHEYVERALYPRVAHAGLIQPPPGYTGGYSGYEKTRIRDNLPLQYPPHYPYPT
jgi:hypothetical protein